MIQFDIQHDTLSGYLPLTKLGKGEIIY
jgi:hypothetical protein